MPILDPKNCAGQEIRILSIDGGGIRGILPARLLQEIESRTSVPIADHFHLLSGTSTGGIIACGLGIGLNPGKMGDLYNKKGSAIFARSLWQKLSNPSELTGPKYETEALEEILSDICGDLHLSDIRTAELLIPTYAIELSKAQNYDGVQSTRTPMFFKTWKARGVDLAKEEKSADFDFALKAVTRATSAAPTYFPPAEITNRAGDKFGAVDGGVFANNPSACALAAAYKLYPKASSYRLVSLGTGTFERQIPYKDAKGWGEISWIHPILSILMDGNADCTSYQCDQVLGDKHHRFEVTLGTDPSDPTTVDDDFDNADFDNIARLERLAERMIKQFDRQIDNLCKILLH